MLPIVGLCSLAHMRSRQEDRPRYYVPQRGRSVSGRESRVLGSDVLFLGT